MPPSTVAAELMRCAGGSIALRNVTRQTAGPQEAGAWDC